MVKVWNTLDDYIKNGSNTTILLLFEIQTKVIGISYGFKLRFIHQVTVKLVKRLSWCLNDYF